MASQESNLHLSDQSMESYLAQQMADKPWMNKHEINGILSFHIMEEFVMQNIAAVSWPTQLPLLQTVIINYGSYLDF